MGLDFAIDELYAAGWSTTDLGGCEHTASGRVYPGVRRVEQEFEDAGRWLRIRYVPAFDCHRAEWSAGPGAPAEGAVVGQSPEEAAVYALARLRAAVAVGV